MRRAAALLVDDRYRWLIWSAVRLLGVLSLVIYPLSSGDLEEYGSWAFQLQHGLLPYRDFNVEYPPGVVPFMSLPVMDPTIFAMGFMLVALVADAATLAVLRTVQGVGRRGIVLWQLLPLAIGPILWARLDVFVALAIVLLLREIQRGHWVRAAFALGAATSLKLWPMVLVLLLLPVVPRAARSAWLWTSAVIIAVPTIVFVALGGGAGLRWMVAFHISRGIEVEALAAVPMHWARLAGAALTVQHSHGSYEFPTDQWTWLLTGTTVAFLGGLVAVAFWVRRWRRQLDAFGIVLITVLVILVTSKVLSPQYFIWVTALVCVGVDQLPRLRDEVALLLTFALVCTQYVFPFCFGPLVIGSTLGVVAMTVHSAVVAALIVFLVRARRPAPARCPAEVCRVPDCSHVLAPALLSA